MGGQCGRNRASQLERSGDEVPELVGLRKEFGFYSQCFLARGVVYLSRSVAGAQLRELGRVRWPPGLMICLALGKLLNFSMSPIPHLLNGD